MRHAHDAQRRLLQMRKLRRHVGLQLDKPRSTIPQRGTVGRAPFFTDPGYNTPTNNARVLKCGTNEWRATHAAINSSGNGTNGRGQNCPGVGLQAEAQSGDRVLHADCGAAHRLSERW